MKKKNLEENSKKNAVYTYLKEIMTPNLQIIISNYFLRDVVIDLFFKVFSNVEKDPKSVAEFILDGNNAYRLAMLGARASGLSNIYAYKGMSNYEGVRCTLGSSHSNYHG